MDEVWKYQLKQDGRHCTLHPFLIGLCVSILFQRYVISWHCMLLLEGCCGREYMKSYKCKDNLFRIKKKNNNNNNTNYWWMIDQHSMWNFQQICWICLNGCNLMWEDCECVQENIPWTILTERFGRRCTRIMCLIHVDTHATCIWT